MSQTPHLPDLTSYRAVHRAIRLAGHRLVLAAERIPPADEPRVRALQRYWKGFAAEVLVHHTIEDDVFFPALAERTPAMAGHLDRLDAEHHELDRLMAAVDATIGDFTAVGGPQRAAAALVRFSRAMDDHLDLEDEDVLPLFERHFTGAGYAELEAQAMSAVGISRQAAFTVPFVIRATDPEERRRTLATAPRPMRVLYALTRRSHERLDRSVFAGVPMPTSNMAAAVR